MLVIYDPNIITCLYDNFCSIDNTTVTISQYVDAYHNICTFKLKLKD